MPRHAEIAGAGFAGLTAALALAQRGWTARVHERDAEPRAFGAGIFLWDNGLRVLDAIGVHDAVVSTAHEAGVYEDRHENRRTAQTAFGPAAGTRMLTMTRQQLYGPILEAARRCPGVDIVTGSEAVGADPAGRLHLRGGETLPADLVVGADGVRSRVRDSLGLRCERTPCHHGVIRVLVPRCRDALGPDDWDHVIDFWNLPHRGLRILYVPCNDDDLYLALTAPLGDAEAGSLPLRHDIWMPAFPQLEPVLRHVPDEGRYDPYETTKLPRWSAGRVAIVGDAAHAMVPALAQGAGVAMMNALSLAVSATQADSIEAALADWETRERPITTFAQDRSAQAAIERVETREQIWNDESLRIARHVPTGTGP